MLNISSDDYTEKLNFPLYPVKPYHGSAISAPIKTQATRRLEKRGDSTAIPFYLAAREDMTKIGLFGVKVLDLGGGDSDISSCGGTFYAG